MRLASIRRSGWLSAGFVAAGALPAARRWTLLVVTGWGIAAVADGEGAQ